MSKDLDDINTVKQHLDLMLKIDQDARKQFLNDKENATLTKLLKEIDVFNTAHLKSILAKYGWVTNSEFGSEADHQAWLLVQHADHDLAFQEKCLCTLENLLPLKETNPKNFAYLFDRVAINKRGDKQRYGTQVKIEEGRIELLPCEGTVQELNERRRRIGLSPLRSIRRGKEIFKTTKP